MLSPANTAEILVGKSLLSFLMTVIVVLLSALLLDYVHENMFLIGIAMILSICFYIGLGTLLGLYTKSVMEASVIVLPFMIIFAFGSFITAFQEQYPILKVANYLPNIQLIDIATKVEAGAGFGDVFQQLGVIFLWVIAVSVLTVLVYRKRMVD